MIEVLDGLYVQGLGGGIELIDGMYKIGNGTSPSYIDVILSGVSPLTLEKAISLNYLKLFGGTEQRNLPSEYTQVEYLQSSGTQYIDLGKISSNDVIDMKFEWTQVSNNYLLGSLEDGSNWQAGKMLGVTYYNTSARAFYNRGTTTSSAGGTATSFNIAANTEYTIHWQPSSNQITVNGTQYTGAADNNNQTTDVFETANNLYLFCANRGGIAGNFDYVKMREFSIVGKCNLIPARRNSDNVLGMYDTVSGNFLTNQGTGAFTAGADVVPTPDTPMDIVCNNGVLKYGVLGKNLLNDTKFRYGYLNATAPEPVESDYISSGTTTSTNWTTMPVKVTAGQSYTIKFFTEETFPLIGYAVYQNGERLQRVGSVAISNNEKTIIPEASGNLYIWCAGGDSIEVTSLIGKVQIELGSTATPYEPYREGIYTDGTIETVQVDTTGDTATAEMLLKVGTYQDVQSVLDGAITRNVGIKVLDGTENWTVNSMISNHFTYKLPNQFDSTTEYKQTYSTHFLSDSGTDDNTCKLQFRTFSIRYDAANENTTTFKQWLADQYAAGTPVIIVYPLAEPTTESVTEQPLTVQAGTNIVEITQASIDNLAMEVGYRQKV